MQFIEYIDKNYKIQIDNYKIEQAIKGIEYCIRNKIQIVACGNGGSGYSASHFIQDLTKVCYASNAISLTDNVGLVTAFANDINYRFIFEEQLKRIPNKYLLIAISCSGNSNNVINAALYTRLFRNMPVLSFTSRDGGRLALPIFSSLNINVPTNNIYVAESVHSMIFHFFVDKLEHRL